MDRVSLFEIPLTPLLQLRKEFFLPFLVDEFLAEDKESDWIYARCLPFSTFAFVVAEASRFTFGKIAFYFPLIAISQLSLNAFRSPFA